MLNAIYRELVAAVIIVGAAGAIAVPFFIRAQMQYKRKQRRAAEQAEVRPDASASWGEAGVPTPAG